MKYLIKNEAGETIAKFEQVLDRDICFDALINFWGDDCQLEIADNE